MSVYLPIPFDVTYILYDPSDTISLISVQFSLLPIYIMVFYFSWFIITREIEPVIVVAGHLVGEVANKVAKSLLKLPRPDFHKDFGAGSYGSSYGMPSAHSQFMGFFAAYFILIIINKVPTLERKTRLVASISLAVCSCLVAFSRVYLYYHTIPQVLVGLMIGVVLGLLLFGFSSLMRDIAVVDWVLTWPIVNFFHIKDSYYHSYQSFKQEKDACEARRALAKRAPASSTQQKGN